MKTISVHGPTLVMRFSGDVKQKAAGLNWVAAAWLASGSTVVAVKLHSKKDLKKAVKIVQREISAPLLSYHFSELGCDVVIQPHSNN